MRCESAEVIVWLASYPRSGNTFLRLVLHEAFGVATHTVYDDDDPVAQRVGPELVGYEPRPVPLAEMAASQQPYFVKTHRLRSDESPALLVVRDGRDAITSYAHMRAAATTNPGDAAAYRLAFEREAEDQINRTDSNTGSWGRNVLSWIDGAHPRRKILRFEDLVSRPSVAVEAAARMVPALPVRLDAGVPTFDELHQRDPTFFRRGTNGSYLAELPSRLLDQFWANAEHRRAMQELGYS
jgi:hypothetical protein